MKTRAIHLERLLGRAVYDVNDKRAGRIEEIEAHREGDRCVIDAFLLGRGAMMARLSIADLSTFFISFLGAHGHQPSHRAKWDLMDLSDPEYPRLKCAAEALEEVEP